MVYDATHRAMVLLVDVTVEDRGAAVLLERGDRLGAVLRGPVPVRVQVEERAVREGDHRRGEGRGREVGAQPSELRLAEGGGGLGHVVERDEMDATVVEAAVEVAEVLAVRLAAIEGGVVLAGQEAHAGHAHAGDDALHLRHAPAPLPRVVGGVGEIAGHDHEGGLLRQRGDGRDGARQRDVGLGIGRAAEAPVRVGELEEEEVVAARPGGRSRGLTGRHRGGDAPGEPRCEHHPAQPAQLEEIPTALFVHRAASDRRSWGCQRRRARTVPGGGRGKNEARSGEPIAPSHVMTLVEGGA
jgi:hypothetical protein